MSTQRIEIDPYGDTLIILPKRFNEFEFDSSNDSKLRPETHFLCSKKHLALASRRAKKMFASGFKEATPQEADGLHHWKFAPIFDPKAFEIVIKIIHGKNRDIPRVVNTELLAEIATIVDDLECHDALWFFAQGWIGDCIYTAPPMMCTAVAQMILISFVFDKPTLFEASTKTAMMTHIGSFPTCGLPIRPKIVGKL